MSLLLKDRVYTMESSTAKRGVYPLHGYKLGIYRLPVKLEDPLEIRSVAEGLKKTFTIDTYADRIYVTYTWIEENMPDIEAKEYEKVELSVTVEIVTGEVIDLIYQIFPIEKFGDPPWVKDYRKKADHYAKMIIDTILRNTIIADKLVTYYVKSKKMGVDDAIQQLEELTPLAKILTDAKPKIKIEEPLEAAIVDVGGPLTEPKPGPIDVEFKTHMRLTSPTVAPTSKHTIKTWGRGPDNGRLGVWGEFVSVDFDICVADGGCIDACPVNVYEWFETPNHISSSKKPLMAREPDCIFCLACEGVCPPQAIKIFPQK